MTMITPTPISHDSSRRGQTLVEALIALSILTVGFIGIVFLLTKSFQLNRTVTDETQATYLAAEGIEVTKSLIDHDVYSGIAVGANDFGKCFPLSGFYYPIDYTTTDCSKLQFSSSQPPKPDTELYFSPTTHLFSAFDPLGGITTDFTRTIHVANNGTSLDVQSIVTWASGDLSNTITLEDVFYDWQP